MVGKKEKSPQDNDMVCCYLSVAVVPVQFGKKKQKALSSKIFPLGFINRKDASMIILQSTPYQGMVI